MAPKFVGFVFFIYVVGIILGAIMEADWAQVTGGESNMNSLLSWREITSEEDFGLFQVPGFVLGVFGSIFNMLTFRFAFMTGDWNIVWLLVFGTIGAIVIYGIIITLIGIFTKSL